MALVRNDATYAVDLSTGRLVVPGEIVNADVDQPHEQSLIRRGVLTVTDGTVDPPAPTSKTVPVVTTVAYSDPSEQVTLDINAEATDAELAAAIAAIGGRFRGAYSSLSTGAVVKANDVVTNPSGALVSRIADGTISGSYNSANWTALSAGSGAGLPATVVSKTANYTAAAGELVKADATSAGFTITLPSSPAVGALVEVKKVDASTNVVTIAPAGSGTIDGQSTATTSTQWAGAIFQHVGSDVWLIPNPTTGPRGATGATGAAGATGPSGGGVWHAKTGFYLASMGSAPSSSACNPGIGYLVAVPFAVPEAFTAVTLGEHIITAAASAVVRMGIYADDGTMRPGSLILDAGTIDGSSSGFKETTAFSQALSAGLYWLAAVQQVAVCSCWSSLNTIPIPAPAASASTVKTYGLANNGGTTGALPGSFGAPAFYQSSLSSAPHILVKAG